MDNLVPAENDATYKLIYQIEVGLREFIIVTLSRVDPRWVRQRLPADVLEKYREGRQEERKAKWIELIPHHPLYYTDFPDLRKIVERTDNWRDVFQGIFADKEVLCGILRELEPIRNKVAHNRRVTKYDVEIIQSAYHTIAASIGEEVFAGLVQRQTVAEDIPSLLRRLWDEAVSSLGLCKSFVPIDALPSWEAVKDQWWFDADYLGHAIDDIRRYFELLADYSRLPRFRGAGHVIEEWIKLNGVDQAFAKARDELAMLIKDVGG